MNNDLISRSALLAAYDKAHQGPPGNARKLIEDAPEAKNNIEFSDEEFDFIKNYVNSVKADTVQTAILNAIKFAIDNEVHELTKDDFESWKKNPRRDPICEVWYGDWTPMWVLRPEQIHEPAFLMGQLKLFNKKPSRDDIHWSSNFADK